MPDYEYQADLDIGAIKKKLEQNAKEFDKFADKADKAFDKIEKEANKAAKATEKVGAAAAKAGKAGASFKEQIGDAVGRNFIAANVLQNTLLGLKDFTLQSFQAANAAQRLGDATDTLGARFGTTGDAIVGAIQKSSNFTINQMNAMQAANQAMLLGVAKSPEEFERLTKIAVQLGRAMGQDATKSVEDLTIGIGRQSRLILDNLGIMVNVERAHQRYAESLGKDVDALTDAEKQQAFLNEALDQGEKKIAGMGNAVLTQADKVERINSRWADFQIEFGKAMQSASDSSGILDFINDGLDQLIDGSKAWQDNTKDAGFLAGAMKNVGLQISPTIEDFKLLGKAISDFFLAPIQAAVTAFSELVKGKGIIDSLQQGFQDLLDPVGEAVTAVTRMVTNEEELGEAFEEQREAAEKASGAVSDSVPISEEAAEAADELAEAQKKAAEAMEKFKTDKARDELDLQIKAERAATDAILDNARKREDIAKKNLQKISDIQSKFRDSVTDAGIDAGRDEADAARDAGRDIAAAAVDARQGEEDAARDTSRSLADISRNQAQKQIDIARQAAQKKADIETAYRRKIQEIAQKFSIAALDAERSRDAVAFLAAKRERDLAFAGAGTERGQALQDVGTETGRAQEEARLEAEREREEARIQAERAKQDRAIENERVREEARIQAEQAAEDRAIENERKMEDLRAQLTRELEEQRLANERDIEEQRLAEERKAEDLATARARDEEDLKTSLERKLADLKASLAAEVAAIKAAESQKTAVTVSESEKRIAQIRKEAAAGPKGTPNNPTFLTPEGPQKRFGSIGRRAAGGPVAPGTSYMVGERGPELFSPNVAGYISPNRTPSSVPALAGAIYSRNDNSTHINAPVDMLDPTKFSAAQKAILRNEVIQMMNEREAAARRAGVR